MSKFNILIEAPNNENLTDYEYRIPFVIENLDVYQKDAEKGDEYARFAIERGYYRALQKVKKKIQSEFEYFIFSPYYHMGYLYTAVIYPNLQRAFENYSNVHIDLDQVYKYITWYGYVNQLKELEVFPYDKEKVLRIKNKKLPLYDLGIVSQFTKEEAIKSYAKRAYKKGIKIKENPED